jgi:hypothetical protein
VGGRFRRTVTTTTEAKTVTAISRATQSLEGGRGGKAPETDTDDHPGPMNGLSRSDRASPRHIPMCRKGSGSSSWRATGPPREMVPEFSGAPRFSRPHPERRAQPGRPEPGQSVSRTSRTVRTGWTVLGGLIRLHRDLVNAEAGVCPRRPPHHRRGHQVLDNSLGHPASTTRPAKGAKASKGFSVIGVCMVMVGTRVYSW